LKVNRDPTGKFVFVTTKQKIGMLCTKNQMEIFEFYLNRIFQDESSTRQLNSYLKVLEHWTEKLDIKIIDL